MDKDKFINIDHILKSSLDDLWLERRFKMDEIIAQVASIGAQDWVIFLRFLSNYCAGSSFSSDKEWSQLLNLMAISKLTNQRTLKFGRLIKNKQQIELNMQKIRQLDESSRHSKALASLMSDLNNGFDGCQLDLSQYSFEQTAIASIEQTLDLIRDTCRVPLESIEKDLSSTNDHVEAIGGRIKQLRQAIDLMTNFLRRLLRLELTIKRLQPLANFEANIKKDSNSAKNHKNMATFRMAMDNSLEDCKAKYKDVIKFHQRLVNYLKDNAEKKQNSLILKRLLKPNLLSLVNEELCSIFLGKYLTSVLECQSELDYNFKKLRLEFGRFYFVNDAELLRIITLDVKLLLDASQENRSLISKLFNGTIEGFSFNHDNSQIIGVRNSFGEIVKFVGHENFVLIVKRINIYSLEIVRIFNECQRKLRSSLKDLLAQAIRLRSGIDDIDQDFSYIDTSLPIQLVCLYEQILFCQKVELELSAMQPDLNKCKSFYENRLIKFKSKDNLAKTNKSNEYSLDAYKHSAIISLTIQFVTIIEDLEARSINSCDDWPWHSRLRYYLMANGDVSCCIADMQFQYKFDYLPFQIQANSSRNARIEFKRLIGTSMTDRCQLVASQALFYLRLGANPFGPAGSGKTETIKALGASLGQTVIVHNCDESNDETRLERLIWGLSHTGLWGCFDEFNRLSKSTLSSVSSTLELVQSGLRRNLKTVENRSGDIMSLDENAAFFITMNPIDDSTRYKGRRRLPANLRALFLPISMVQVPMVTIVDEYLRISSFMKGFRNENLRDIASKLCQLFQEMKTNSVATYDNGTSTCEWDLRLVVPIIQRFRQSPDNDQSLIRQLVSSIQTEVEPRLGGSQVNLFREKLSNYLSTEMSILKETLPQNNDSDRRLFEALQSQLQTRIGVLLLGPTGSGKSRTWNHFNEDQNNQVEIVCMNPRSCKTSQLFGSFVGKEGGEWVDGLFTSCLRSALEILDRQNSSVQQVWIVLDGPIEPDWVEALNSVLDDNQILTLASGERISFSNDHLIREETHSGQGSKCIKIIFETDSIDYVSPATISRLGLVRFEAQKSAKSNQISQINDKVMTNTHRILMIVNDSVNIIDTRQLGIDESKSMRYVCHPGSQANDLMKVFVLAIKHHKKIIKLLNIENIEPEVQWKVNTFQELLRHAITYGYFYDELRSWKKTSVRDIKIIACVSNISKIENQRLMSLAQIFQVNQHSINKPNQMEADTLGAYIDGGDSTLRDTGVLTVLCNGHNIEKLIERLLRDSKIDSSTTRTIYQFCNSRQSKQNIEILIEKLNSEDHVSYGKSESRCLLLMTELQLSLMDGGDRSNLLHYLNELQLKPEAGLFVFFTQTITPIDVYWPALGSMVELKPYESLSLIERFKLLSINWQDLGHEKLDSIKDKFMKQFQSIQDVNERQESEYLHLSCSLKLQFDTYITEELSMLKTSLGRLNALEVNIESLRDTCEKRNILLDDQRHEISHLVKNLDLSLNEAEMKKSEIESLKASQSEKSSQLRERKMQLGDRLENVKKQVEVSKQDIRALLKPAALNEIRTLRSPPKIIKDILDGLLIVIGMTDTSWTTAKSFLARTTMRDEILSFDLERNLNFEIINKLQKLIDDPDKRDSFDLVKAARASKAIIPLLKWLLAVIEFGRITLELKPMIIEMRDLELDQEEKQKKVVECENVLRDIDTKINDERQKLNELRESYEKSQIESDTLKHQIDEAQESLTNCAGITANWHSRLSDLRALQTNQVTLDLAVSMASKAILNIDNDFIQNNMKTLLDLTCHNQVPDESLNQDINLIRDMILLRIFLDQSSLEYIPFIDIGQDSNGRLLIDKLKSLILEHGRIVLNGDRDISIITCNKLSDWFVSLNMASRLGKVVILHLENQVDSTTLDVLDIVRQLRSSNLKARVIFVGSSRNLVSLTSLGPVRVIQMESLSQIEDTNQLSNYIMDKLIGKYDRGLSDNLRMTQSELRLKRSSIFEMQSKLFEKLSQVEETNFNKLDESLIKTLSQLHNSSVELESDIVKLNLHYETISKRKSEYMYLAEQLSSVYINQFVPLNRLSDFYYLSQNKFIKLVLQQSNSMDNINWSRLYNFVLQSLTPKDRSEFVDKFENSINHDSLKDSYGLQSSIVEMITGDAETTTVPQFELIITIHEASKSSPLIIIEDIFKRYQQAKLFKLFASINDIQSLETKLLELARGFQVDKIVFVAIVNSHLVADWINSRLLALVDSGKLDNIKMILIGETEQSSNAPWNTEIIDRASIRCWYDEVSVPLSHRFEIYESALKPTRDDEEPIQKLDSQLTKQLILFHVVCQELTMLPKSHDRAWIGNYLFDYDLLVKARFTMAKMLEGQQYFDTKSRQKICHFLQHVSYGAQLSCEQDEARMIELVDRFFWIHGSNRTNKSYDLFEELRKVRSSKVLLSELVTSNP